MTAELDLLSKNELRVTGVDLVDADLREIASTVADVLQLEGDEVLVTDYLDRTLTLDILRRSVYPHMLLGHEPELLERLRALPGVVLDDTASITADGVLGWIAADAAPTAEALAAARAAAARMSQLIARRSCVISTGAEIADGSVRDTNRALLESRLGEHGFSVEFAGTAADDELRLLAALQRAAQGGYGLIITTGGVGAEAKDRTVEAVLLADPQAHTPFICTFQGDGAGRNHGRHVKPGVRIAVGRIDGSLVVSLPGPTAEVDAALDVLLAMLGRDDCGDAELAEAIAQRLRQTWRAAHSHDQETT